MDQKFYEVSNGIEVTPTDIDDKKELESYYKNLGERIKKAREEAGFTLAKLANIIGITPSAIANYESGIRQIPVHMLLDLARTLGKPIHFFLGPNVETSYLITQALKTSIEKFTDATYIKAFYKLENDSLEEIDERPEPLVPVPPEIAKDHDFAIRQFNERTGTFNYLICKLYKPQIKTTGLPFLKKINEEFIPPEPDDWVIAEIGDTLKWQLVQYRDVTPSSGWKDKEYTINVRAIVIARVERLVK